MSVMMTPDPAHDAHMSREIARRRAEGRPFALATVVRTLAATSAKPGAKALIDETGEIVAGFLGGGCVRGAVARTARAAIAGGAPQLLSLKPGDLLDAEGIAPGEERDGIRYARNGCPSRGSLDIFIEPVLPRPRLLICGAGPVARALAEMAARFDFDRALALPGGALDGLPAVDSVTTFENAGWDGAPYVVIATQGRGDEAALRHALGSDAAYIAFVGSRRKFAALSDRLAADGVAPEALGRVHAPAGLDIRAITPDEIALSILAQIVQVRRAGQRSAAGES